MAPTDADTSRTAARTYVPAYQKAEWQHHADKLEMSLSEFIRTMVQAGRRGFTDGDRAEPDQPSEPTSAGTADLETQVVSVLADSGPLSWDDLLTAVTGEIESQLEDTLQDLQAANRVQYSGREGGYVLRDR